MELVRVWVGVLGLSQLVDGTGSNLEILLCPSVSLVLPLNLAG
jgi:hypothetical protein